MDLQLSCQCGEVKGEINNLSPKKANHIICYCDYCQAYAHYLKKEGTLLDQNAGLEIFQLDATEVHFTQGREKIKPVGLSNRLIRWHTECCQTPVAATLPKAKPSFAGIPVEFIVNKKELGPIIAKVHARYAKGTPPSDAHMKISLSFLFRFIKMIIPSLLKKQSGINPFFNKNGEMMADPYFLSSQERKKFLTKVRPA